MSTGGDDQDELEQAIQAEAKGRTSPSPRIVHTTIVLEGIEDLDRGKLALAWSGVAAGLTMGFSLVAEGLLRARLPDRQWTPLVAKLGYTVGFLFVTLGRQQLFTETTLTATLPVLHERTRRRLVQMLRLWGIVLFANLLGAFAFAAAIAHTGIFSPEMRDASAAIGQQAMHHSFVDALLKAIVGGWLVALMVWLMPAAETARVWTIIITTYVLGAGELTHVIAGSVEAFYLVAAGQVGFITYLGGFLVPVLLGNTVGGLLLVAALNHAQVVGIGD